MLIFNKLEQNKSNFFKPSIKMKKLTKTQIFTIIACIGYIIWEITVQVWEKSLPPSDPVIRVDLLLIFPILAILIIISLVQFIKSQKK